MSRLSLRALVRTGSWCVADQAIQSVANFAMLVVFARAATPGDFGLFALAVTGVNFEMTLAAAALNQPFVILGSARRAAEYRRCVTSTLLIHCGAGGIVASLLLVCAGIASALGADYARLLLILPAAVVAAQLQDFLRQALYVENRERAACVNDLLNYGGLCGGVAALAAADALTPARGLTVMAVVSSLAVLVGLVQLRKSLRWTVRLAELRADRRESWQLGRWTLGGAALSVSSSYLTPFVLGASAGAAAAGALRAMLAVMGPVNIVYRTIGTSVVPAAVRAFASGGVSAITALMWRVTLVLVLPTSLYGLGIALFARPILTAVYGDHYADVAWAMPLVAMSFVVGTVSVLVDAALRGRGLTKAPFQASAANFVFFWVVGAPVIVAFGLAGAAVTLLIAACIALTLLLARFGHALRPGRPLALNAG